MSDVGKVGGPGERQGPEGPKKKKGVGGDAFREMMKVGKIREVDPEEKRKRKRREEAEEEAGAAGQLQPKPLPQQGVPGKEGPSDFDLALGRKGLEGAPPSQAGQRSRAPMAPPPQEGEEAPPPYAPQEEETPQIQQQGPPSAQKKQKAKGKKETTKPEEKKKAKTAEHPAKTKKQVGKTGEAPKLHKAESPKKPEEKDTFFKQMGETPPKEAKKEEKKDRVEGQVVEGAPPLPQGSWESIKKPDEKKDETAPGVESEAQVFQPDTTQPTPLVAAPPVAETPPQYLNLPPEVLRLFDRMVGVMTVMSGSGIKETTITLNAPQFAKSVFYGTEITITEFSTAPLQFNIQLTGTPQAVNLFQGNAQELVAAFQAGKYNFKVNRIETGVASTADEIKRKGKVQPVKRKKQGD